MTKWGQVDFFEQKMNRMFFLSEADNRVVAGGGSMADGTHESGITYKLKRKLGVREGTSDWRLARVNLT